MQFVKLRTMPMLMQIGFTVVKVAARPVCRSG